MISDTITKNNKIIRDFIAQYELTKTPIEVSFRNLLPEIKNIDRHTHLIHSYPAKLLVHIPYLFLNNTVLSKVGDFVLDPFSGSGTVMLEALLSKRNAFGADSNPLARLISEVKVSNLDICELRCISKNLILRARKYKRYNTPDIINLEYWFPPNTVESLAKISTAINKIKNISIRKFMLVCFSNCVKKVSYADQRISVPVKLNANRYKDKSVQNKKILDRLKYLNTVDVFEKFQSILDENITRCENLQLELIDKKYTAKIISQDARNITCKLYGSKKMPEKTIQLIITSPPYAGAQKYIRASSLNLGWTGLSSIENLMVLDKKNIGRENFRKSEINITKTGIPDADALIEKISTINISRANIVCTYIHEMKEAINEMIRVVKKGGFIVLIVGNNKVCNMEFNTQEYMTYYLQQKNLNLKFKLIDDIKSYGLMTKRNKTADIISREWILVFKK